MHATLTNARYDPASLSYRVATRRNSLSLAMQRSTTFRRRYAARISRGQASRSRTCSVSRSRDHRPHAPAREPPPDLVGTVPLVAGEARGPSAAEVGHGRADERPDGLALVAVAAGQQHLQDVAAAVAQHVQLAAEPAAGQA